MYVYVYVPWWDFKKKKKYIYIYIVWNFNEMLTNDVISFEQLGPDLCTYLVTQLSYLCRCSYVDQKYEIILSSI